MKAPAHIASDTSTLAPAPGRPGVHILGIRHHGPGSARAVRRSLEALQPDIVLVEGPPDADVILPWMTHTELKPPVAILCYRTDQPRQSVFYPFAEFSPEWQAIQYALGRKIPVRFCDLPMAHCFALDKESMEKIGSQTDTAEGEASEYGLAETSCTESTASNPPTIQTLQHSNPESPQDKDEEENEQGEDPHTAAIRRDPIAYLARADGYEDGERWWEHMFEYRQGSDEVFEAVTEAMQGLREGLPEEEDGREALREAYMRKTIRQAQREGFATIAVVCGAWHAPALAAMPPQKSDNELLKNLPKTKVECTWIPWTYDRLSYRSGYGAGIHSPGWYEHIWHHPGDDGTRWLSKVAALLRSKGMDTSVAHVIEGVRLANALAALRAYPRAGLEELNEAALSVICGGEALLLELIRSELIVSNCLGEVPDDIPKPPLQADIEKSQKSLRLPATPDPKDYTLDLRKEGDLARSVFLHRLRLLGIGWGEPLSASGKGTFKEGWRTQWKPEFSIDIIERGTWGNTVADAANAWIIREAQKTDSIPSIAQWLEEALPAELHAAVEALIQELDNRAAASADVVGLMGAVPPLVAVVRYGNVRKTDAERVLPIVRSMVARISIGLPNAAAGMAEEAAADLLQAMGALGESIGLLAEDDLTQAWQQSLKGVSLSPSATPLLSGYATRLLADARVLEGEALAQAFHYRMSAATPPGQSASWLEGFLRGSGSILLVDEGLWSLVYGWVAGLEEDTFTQVLPLLRRSFSLFAPPERRKLGEKAKGGSGGMRSRFATDVSIDPVRAEKGIPVVLQLLGISPTTQEIELPFVFTDYESRI